MADPRWRVGAGASIDSSRRFRVRFGALSPRWRRVVPFGVQIGARQRRERLPTAADESISLFPKHSTLSSRDDGNVSTAQRNALRSRGIV